MRQAFQKSRTPSQNQIIIGAIFWVGSLFWGGGSASAESQHSDSHLKTRQISAISEKLGQALVTSKCEADFKAYVGCISALEVLAARIPGTQLAAENSRDTSLALAFGSVKESFGALKWIEKSDSFLPLHTEGQIFTHASQRKNFVFQRERRFQRLSALYRRSAILFEKAYARLSFAVSQQKLSDDAMLETAMAAYNSYLGAVYDPHTRLQLPIPSQQKREASELIQAQVVESLGVRMGWIRMDSFSDHKICEVMEQKLREILRGDVQGIILDLRGNLGGYVPQAECLAGLFFGKKILYYQQSIKESALAEKTPKYATHDAIIPATMPMVTLVNAHSASCSEMVAGALQDHQRSWIVGEKTYGKATIQMPSSLVEGMVYYQSALRFFQPSGSTNQMVGITPDFEISNPAAGPWVALREADLYWNALPEAGTAWSQPRIQKAEAIQHCRDRFQYAARVYSGATSADYQLIAAQEVVACSRY